MPAKKSASKTLAELGSRIDERASAKADAAYEQAVLCVDGFAKRNRLSMRAICKALLGVQDELRQEVKTNIINEIVKQAEEEKIP